MAVTILYILMCELGHFLLAFISGLIAWLLMTAIYNWMYSTVQLTRTDTTPGPLTQTIMGYSSQLIFLMAISVALLSHVLEDYYIGIV